MADPWASLPVPGNPLVGRKKELVDVRRLLLRERARAVAIVGPAGVGKTRFAIAAAAEAADGFPGGVGFVARVDAGGLRVPHSVDVRGEQFLLVLDELDGDDRDVPALLAGAPRLQVLATGRSRIEWACEVRLGPLPEAPAVELLRQRAPAVEVDYETAVAICDRVGRLPLAIERAAARLATCGPAALFAALDTPG